MGLSCTNSDRIMRLSLRYILYTKKNPSHLDHLFFFFFFFKEKKKKEERIMNDFIFLLNYIYIYDYISLLFFLMYNCTSFLKKFTKYAHKFSV